MARKKVDVDEFDLPETVFVRDIEDRVFQGIVLQSLAKIDGITLLEGNFIDHLLGRRGVESLKGIYIEQDPKHQSVSIKVEVNIAFGEPIPQKAEEIQSMIAQEVTRLTGLHVASVHVIFKDVIPQDQLKKISDLLSPVENEETASD